MAGLPAWKWLHAQFSNSSKHGILKKRKIYANRLLNYKGSHAGNYLYNENCTNTANLPYYPLLRSRTVKRPRLNMNQCYKVYTSNKDAEINWLFCDKLSTITLVFEKQCLVHHCIYCVMGAQMKYWGFYPDGHTGIACRQSILYPKFTKIKSPLKKCHAQTGQSIMIHYLVDLSWTVDTNTYVSIT